jgi:protein gp37
MKKYQGETQIYYKELGKIRRYGKDAFVFVEDMSDLMAAPKEYILKVLEAISESPATFLLLDKNPLRYLEFELPENVVAGATIETDIDWKVSKAPIPLYRIRAMQNLKHKRKMVSVEPIMKFSPQFIRQLLLIQPEFVAVGYDNYNNHLPEPPLEITEILISGLEAYGIKVYRKTMREANQ